MNIVCIGDLYDSTIRDITFEEMALAQKIREKDGGEIDLILIGSNLDVLSEKLKNYSLRKVIYIDDSRLALYNQDLYTLSVVSYLKQNPPDVLIVPQNSMGLDLAVPLAEDLELQVITNCESAGLENGKMTATRTIYGGKIKEEVFVDSPRVILTLRPGDFGAAAEQPSSPEFVKFQPDIDWNASKITSIEVKKPATEDIDITKLGALVSIGRGLGNVNNMKIIEELAQQLKTVVVCSRPVVDMGWLPRVRQVGTSGKTVAPKLYLALGISGATNHVNGMKRSEIIIAVNKDPTAEIFKISKYGAVADLLEIVPLLTEELKNA